MTRPLLSSLVLSLSSLAIIVGGCGEPSPVDAGVDGAPPDGDGGGRDAGPGDAGSEPCTSPGTIESVACGSCGTVERFCTAGGTWSYSECEGASGACEPGTMRTGDCGRCGSVMQRCTATCEWQDDGVCAGEGVCAPGTMTRNGTGCPAGETRDVTCNDACAYEASSDCERDECTSPGTTETVACGMCGTRERFCASDGVWAYGTCGDEGVCSPGATGTQSCGVCGTQTTVCDSTCEWAAFGACTGEEACCLPASDDVDLLFMVDNSNSMAHEQASLASELPRLIRALATGDIDADGTPDVAPIGSLHAGVISSDMGTGGTPVPTCPRSEFGDDGVLRTQGRTDIAGCMATYPSFLSFDPTDDVDAFASDLACVSTIGTGGCGFEQQLEAALKALSPSLPTSWTSSSFVAPTFFGGTFGHGSSTNAGFVRDGSLLAVVLVTDEEDCSAADPEIFNPSSPTYTADLNLRCFSYPSALHPTSRFVDGLVQLRRDPRRLVVTSIVGIPSDAEPTTLVPDYTTILAHPDMVERVDPSSGFLTPSCNTARGVAYPPRRILSMQRDLETRGVATTTGSICQASYSAVTSRILTRIAERLVGTCP